MEDLHYETEAMKAPQMNKNTVIKYLRDTRDKVTEGEYDPINAFIIMKDIEKVFKGCLETIKEEAKFSIGEETIFKDGYQLKKKDTGSTYKYEEIEGWVKLKVQLDKIENCAKFNYHNLSKIETFTDKETGEVFNKETGELLIVPIVTGKKSSIDLIKIKK